LLIIESHVSWVHSEDAATDDMQMGLHSQNLPVLCVEVSGKTTIATGLTLHTKGHIRISTCLGLYTFTVTFDNVWRPVFVRTL
jgi:hypothetical protein